MAWRPKRRCASSRILGDQVKTSYIENVPDGVEAEKALRQLSQDGNKVIIATTFGYMNPLIKVAKQYPKTVYLHATGFRTDDNIGTFDVRTSATSTPSPSAPAAPPPAPPSA